MPNSHIKEGDIAVIWTSDNRTRTVKITRYEMHRTHQGEVVLGELIGKEFGCRFELTRGWGLALKPALEDRLQRVKRRTNVLYPKDIGLILMKVPIGPGSSVVEIGTGSGAMTAALGEAVSPGGTVFTFDIREEHISAAQRNVRRTGIEADIRFELHKPGSPLPVGAVDCIIMDIPEPWEELPQADAILNIGGRVAAMNPTYNQIEKMATALNDHNYILIECIEIIFRRIVPIEGRVRPVRSGIPHTEFMLFGIKSGQELSEDEPQYLSE